MPLKYKEDLTTYMISGSIHLSKKDYRFFNNIKSQLLNKKPITSNQDKLFSKLLFKYKRQFIKLGYDVEQLNSLVWASEVILSQAEYLSAKISIENNQITIRCPYNTKFIQKFKKIPTNNFVWKKQANCYIANISTHNLKIAFNETNKYFNDVIYDTNVQKILDELEGYKSCNIWDPTLIKVDQNFYIFGINESIHQVISNLKLFDDPNTLHKLSQYGIKIHESILQDDEFKRFASEFYVECDIDNLDTLSDWVEILKFDCIYLGSDTIYSKEISKSIKDVLGNIPMTRNINDLNLYTNVLYLNYKFYRTTNSSSILLYNNELHRNISKVLTVKNSRPVYVK